MNKKQKEVAKEFDISSRRIHSDTFLIEGFLFLAMAVFFVISRYTVLFHSICMIGILFAVSGIFYFFRAFVEGAPKRVKTFDVIFGVLSISQGLLVLFGIVSSIDFFMMFLVFLLIARSVGFMALALETSNKDSMVSMLSILVSLVSFFFMLYFIFHSMAVIEHVRVYSVLIFGIYALAELTIGSRIKTLELRAA